jgi:non-ribosomal peptide synthetase component F
LTVERFDFSSAGKGGKRVLLNQILRHAARDPGKVAIYSDGVAIDYRTFAQALLKIRHHIGETLPAPSGIALLGSPHLVNQWFLNIALRSLGITTAVARDPAITDTLRRLPGTILVCGSRTEGAVPAIHQRWPDLPIFEIPAAAINAINADALPPIIDDSRFGDYIEFTSGSTGDPKLLIRSGATIEALWTRTAAEFRIERDSVFHLQDIAAWTAVGGKLPLTCWAMGGTCVFDQRTDWLDHLLDHPINRMFLTPGQLKLVATRDFPRRPEPGLQIYCGGGFLAAPLAARLRDALQCRVFLNYGGTEFGVRLQNEIETEEDAIWLRPVQNADLRLVDDLGRPAADGVEATIEVKRHACDPVPFVVGADRADPADEGAYFSTNDLGMRRADGRIRILGRAGEVLNVAGYKTALGPVEDQARALLGIDSLCLLVRQTDNGEDYLTVAVEGDQMLDRGRLNAFLTEMGAKFYRTEFRAFAAFPRESSGMRKVNRRELLRLVEQSK